MERSRLAFFPGTTTSPFFSSSGIAANYALYAAAFG